MSKLLTDREMIDIIRRAPTEIDDQDSYLCFLDGLADLISDHFGGTHTSSGYDEDMQQEEGTGYACWFLVDDTVPADGGIYKDYDTDVTWKDSKEL